MGKRSPGQENGVKTEDDRLLTPVETAQKLGLTPTALNTHRVRGRIPFVRMTVAEGRED